MHPKESITDTSSLQWTYNDIKEWSFSQIFLISSSVLLSSVPCRIPPIASYKSSDVLKSSWPSSNIPEKIHSNVFTLKKWHTRTGEYVKGDGRFYIIWKNTVNRPGFEPRLLDSLVRCSTILNCSTKWIQQNTRMEPKSVQSGSTLFLHVYDLGSVLYLLSIYFVFTLGLIIEPSF